MHFRWLYLDVDRTVLIFGAKLDWDYDLFFCLERDLLAV